MRSLAKRVIKQITGDKRTIVLIFFAPLLILTFIYLLLGDTSYKPVIAVQENNLPPVIVSGLNAQNVNIVNVVIDGLDAEQYLKDNKKVDAIFYINNSAVNLIMYESTVKSGQVIKAVQNVVSALNPSAQMNTKFVVGDPDDTIFNSMGYIFFGIVSFFLIFIVSSMALVQERSSGTLERMLMTPVTRVSVIGGYTIGYGIFAVIQSVILVLFSIYVLGFHSEGNVGWVIFIMLLLAVSAVSFGELISIFSNTEFQVVQFIPITIIPQVFFSGLIPLETIPFHLGNLCYIMPIYYGCTAIKEVMVLGHGFAAILPYVLALLAYIFILSVLNTMALKKYRKL